MSVEQRWSRCLLPRHQIETSMPCCGVCARGADARSQARPDAVDRVWSVVKDKQESHTHTHTHTHTHDDEVDGGKRRKAVSWKDVCLNNNDQTTYLLTITLLLYTLPHNVNLTAAFGLHHMHCFVHAGPPQIPPGTTKNTKMNRGKHSGIARCVRK
jgi:hypothetical protein